MRTTRKRWLLAAVGLGAAAGNARASDFVFTTNGDWNTPSNWTPPGPPGVSDTATVASGLTATISNTPLSPIDSLYLGGQNVSFFPTPVSGNGTLNQTAGDFVVNTTAVLGLNGPESDSSGSGTYNLSGGTLTVGGSQFMTVGQSGTGTFNISGNATATIAGRLSLGGINDPTMGAGTGTVVQGGTSSVTVNGVGGGNEALYVGAQGTGSYTLKDNATLTVAKDVFLGGSHLSTAANGTFTQTGGTFTQTDGWFYLGHDQGSQGTYNLSGGTLSIRHRFIIGSQAPGTMNQTGGNFTVGIPGGIDEDLNVGDVATGTYNLSGGSVTANGGLWVGEWNGATGTMNISGNATVNTTDLAVARNEGFSDPAQVRTTGVVNQTGGTVTVQNTTMLGLDPGQNTNGATVGTYTLSGGKLVLGTGGLQLGGTGIARDPSTGVVTGNTTGATGIFNLRGTGVLEASRGVIQIGQGAGSTSAFNMTGGTLQNPAQIMFPLNQQGGTFQPGDPGAPATAMIAGNGSSSYTLGSAGTFHVEIAGATADQLQATGGATSLAGALNVLIDGTTVPRHGATITIMTGQSISGHFSNAATTYISSQGLFHVNYSPTAVTLSGFSLPGDANENGTVAFNDLLTLAQHYGQTGQTWNTGDFNNNGTVEFADLLALAQHYGQSNASVGGLAAVPEPASLVCLLAPAAGLLRRRRYPRNPHR